MWTRQIPEDQYLICNMELWGYRVNYWYVPLDDKDHEKHRQELLRYGIHGEDEYCQGGAWMLKKEWIEGRL